MNGLVTCSTMSKMAFASKGAISCQLPLIANPSFPIRGLGIGSTHRTGCCTTIPARSQAYGHTFPVLGLLIMKECAIISIRTTLLSIKLLAMPALIRPLRVPNKIDWAQWGYLILLPRLRRHPLLLLVLRHNLLPIGRRPTKLLDAVSEITVSNVGASACTELATEFGLEKHFSYGFGSVGGGNILGILGFFVRGFASRARLRLSLVIIRVRRRVVAIVVVPSSVIVLCSPHGVVVDRPIFRTTSGDYLDHVATREIHLGLEFFGYFSVTKKVEKLKP